MTKKPMKPLTYHQYLVLKEISEGRRNMPGIFHPEFRGLKSRGLITFKKEFWSGRDYVVKPAISMKKIEAIVTEAQKRFRKEKTR